MRTRVNRLGRWVFWFAGVFFLASIVQGEVNRLVIIKVDGLPERLVEQYAREPGGAGREGRTLLPWIQEVFGKNGTWMDNFYVRGLSLSAPSWSMLDTGRHLEIRGNAEYDRYTLRVYDYLNMFPFYLNYATWHRVDMPGVELLDDRNIPLLLDRFPYAEQHQGFQLYQRGVRWSTLKGSLKQGLERPPKELFDEWQSGFTMTHSVNDQLEKELLEKLTDPKIRYLDFFTGDVDHVEHLTADRLSQLHEIQGVDALVGRVWNAIEKSPSASTTALVVVSDHGMNTTEGIYSQGYNLVDWFNSAEGGAQNVLTNRHPLEEFKLRGLDPLVSEVVSPTKESTYLAGQTQYPTVTLELDGNEKAAISLRSNTLNISQILLDQLIHKRVDGKLRAATLNAFFDLLNSVRVRWERDLEALDDQIAGLEKRIAARKKDVENAPKKWTQDQRDQGLDKIARRAAAQVESWRAERQAYQRYSSIMRRLLALTPADSDLRNMKIEELIPPRSLGPENSIFDLRNYVAGMAPGGLVLAADGSLDFGRSFRRVDYFPALVALSVRNNVQKNVDSQPVDFLAVPLPEGDGVWLYTSEDKQALIRTRRSPSGQELQYLPIARFRMDSTGQITYDTQDFAEGFPLHIYEDPEFRLSKSWLGEWHTEREWLEAVHRTKYSNGIIGITEALLAEPNPDPTTEARRRRLRTDMLVLARDHWNFNARGFNPGGNHGSFFRNSTHSVFLIAGGAKTRIPRGLHVETPYDSLSFVPTLLTLMGRPQADLPGPVVLELLP